MFVIWFGVVQCWKINPKSDPSSFQTRTSKQIKKYIGFCVFLFQSFQAIYDFDLHRFTRV